MWYRTSQKNIKLSPLESEAIKYDNFEDFKKAFGLEIKHGRYWHITDNPHFTINPDYAPRDMSSMANGVGANKGLMITSDLDHWASHYGSRSQKALSL